VVDRKPDPHNPYGSIDIGYPRYLLCSPAQETLEENKALSSFTVNLGSIHPPSRAYLAGDVPINGGFLITCRKLKRLIYYL